MAVATTTPDAFLVPPASAIFKLWFLDNWTLEQLAAQFKDVSMQLLVLFFLISIGIYMLRALHGFNLEERVWTFVLCGIFILLWPIMVVSLKELVDGFNGYLVHALQLENFTNTAMNQSFFSDMALRFSAPAIASADPTDPANQGVTGMIHRLIDQPVAEILQITGAHFWLGFVNSGLTIAASGSRVVVQALYNIYFFLFTLLGPMVIARAVFSENLESFFELVQEFLVVMLWPTGYIVIAGFFVKSWAATQSSFITSLSQIHIQLGLALAFIVLTFLVPPITKKFATAIGNTIVTPFLRFGGIAMGLTAGQALMGFAGKAFGLSAVPHIAHSAEKYISLGEIVHETAHAQHYAHAAHGLHHALHKTHHELLHAQAHGGHGDHGGHDDHHGSHGDHGGGHHGGHEDHSSHGAHAHAEHHEHQHAHHEEHHHSEEHHGDHHEELPPLVAASTGPAFKGASDKLKSWIDRFEWKPPSARKMSQVSTKEIKSTNHRKKQSMAEWLHQEAIQPSSAAPLETKNLSLSEQPSRQNTEASS